MCVPEKLTAFRSAIDRREAIALQAGEKGLIHSGSIVELVCSVCIGREVIPHVRSPSYGVQYDVSQTSLAPAAVLDALIGRHKQVVHSAGGT
jgi:hypothetical protein